MGRRAQKIHQFAMRGIALVHKYMPVIARVQGQHAVTQNGGSYARLVLGQHRRRIKGNNKVFHRGTKKIPRCEPLHKAVPPHVGRQVVTAAGDDMLMIQRQTGQSGPLRRTWYKVFQIGHADIWLELVNETQDLFNIPLPVPKQRNGFFNGGSHVHLVIFEHRTQVGQTMHWKFRFKNFGGVVVGHKKKLMLAQAAGNGQAAHGMAVPRAVNAIKNAGHIFPFFLEQVVVEIPCCSMKMPQLPALFSCFKACGTSVLSTP